MKNKINYKGELSLYSCPTVLVTSKWKEHENVLTVSWAGIASSHPEYISIAINKTRFSHSLINNSLKFCINIPNSDMLEKVDFCGSNSGRNVNKFQICDFQKEYYENSYILINNCPVSIICKVEHICSLGSHDLFIGRVLEKMIDKRIQEIHKEIKPIIYIRPYYYDIGDSVLGHYGFTKKDMI